MMRTVLAVALAYLVALQGLSTSLAKERIDPLGKGIICSHVPNQHAPGRQPAPKPCCVLMACCAAFHLLDSAAGQPEGRLIRASSRARYVVRDFGLSARLRRLPVNARAPPIEA